MAVWRPFTLLLLWIPGYLSLSCPSSVNGTIGGSLSVRCTYEEEDAGKEKYWCKSSRWLWNKEIVRSSSTKRKVTKDGVTIRDDPANLTVTVTLEHLRAADSGTYTVGISRSLSLDPNVQVVVSVFPAPKTTPLAPVTNLLATVTKTETSPWTTQSTSMLPTMLATTDFSQRTHGQNAPSAGNDDINLLVLLSVLTLLLLLLGVTSLLAWRMIRRRQVRAIKNLAPVRDSCQAVERNELEPCYANLELETLRPSGGHPEPLGQLEVEYSTVAAPWEELHYSTVVFSPQDQDSQTNGKPPHRSLEPEYSVVQRQRKT